VEFHVLNCCYSDFIVREMACTEILCLRRERMGRDMYRTVVLVREVFGEGHLLNFFIGR
jgi:hypothetical protein